MPTFRLNLVLLSSSANKPGTVPFFLDCFILEDVVHSKRRQLLALRNCVTSQKTPIFNRKAKTAQIWHKVVSAEAILYASRFVASLFAGTSPIASQLLFKTECRNTRAKKPRRRSQYEMGWMESSPLINTNHEARYKFYCFLLVLPPPYVQTSSWALCSRTPSALEMLTP